MKQSWFLSFRVCVTINSFSSLRVIASIGHPKWSEPLLKVKLIDDHYFAIDGCYYCHLIYEFVSQHHLYKTKYYQLFSSNSTKQYLKFVYTYTVDVQSQSHKILCIFKVFRNRKFPQRIQINQKCSMSKLPSEKASILTHSK